MYFSFVAYCLAFLLSTAPVQQEKKSSILHYVHKASSIKNAKAPLLILLHGIGSNESDLFSLANQLPDNFLIVSARGPYRYGVEGYSWFDADFSTGKPVINQQQERKSRGTILQFIEELKQIHSIDEKQIYLCGFSQGAIMSYSVGLTHPDKIRGIALLGGRMVDDIKTQTVSSPALSKMKILILHGSKDQIISVDKAREAKTFLTGLGLKPEYREFPVGHEITGEMVKSLRQWLVN